MGKNLDPEHSQKRAVLRVVGPVVVGVGAIFTLIGMISFFSAFGRFGGFPQYFWCALVGLPLLAIGIGLCKFAYLGAVTRYVANEWAPVGKDVVNYMADGTKGAVRDLASAVGQGLRQSEDHAGRIVRCFKCNADNDESANFCQHCGASLNNTKACSACGQSNDPDARFCDNCGKGFD